MKISRRSLLAGTILSGCAARKAGTGCESLAGQTVRWIVPFAAGGGNDLYSRIFEPHFEKTLSAEIVVSNEPGGGSLVGLSKLRDAPPDGRTCGVLNTPGMLAASLFGQAGYPDPIRDFAILGRLSQFQPVIATSATSGIRSIADLLERQKQKPLLCGITGVASNNLFNMAVTASILNLRLDYIPGFNGNVEVQLAALRGDVDLLSNSFENLQNGAENGDLRILLQISAGPISDHPSLKGVPWLAGPEGLAATHSDAAALVSVSSTGLNVAAPKNLPADLLLCLRAAFDKTAADPAFLAAAAASRRPLNIAPGSRMEQAIRSAAAEMERFGPIVRAVLERVRQ